MLAKTSAGGLCIAFPDVCLTPAPPSPSPVPVPYPNVGTAPPMTNGDNAGLGTGIASGTVMAPARTMTGAFTVLVGGMPLARLTSVTLQNSTNAPGAKVVPSVTNVLVLAP